MIKIMANPGDSTQQTITRVFELPITINMFDLTIENVQDYNDILLTGLDPKVLKDIADYFSVTVRKVTDSFAGSPSDGSYYNYKKNNIRFNKRQTAWFLHIGWLIDNSIKRGKSPEWWFKKMCYTGTIPCKLTGTSHNISFLDCCLQPIYLSNIRRNFNDCTTRYRI